MNALRALAFDSNAPAARRAFALFVSIRTESAFRSASYLAAASFAATCVRESLIACESIVALTRLATRARLLGISAACGCIDTADSATRPASFDGGATKLEV